MFVYFVTNRHVAECWNEDGIPSTVLSGLVYLNLKIGTVAAFSLQQLGINSWRFSTDDSVDLAVSPVSYSEQFDNLVIPLDIAVTKDYLKANFIGEGSRIIMSGFFYQWPGNRRIEPIVREGILSMIPDEPILTTVRKPGSLYLADMHILEETVAHL